MARYGTPEEKVAASRPRSGKSESARWVGRLGLASTTEVRSGSGAGAAASSEEASNREANMGDSELTDPEQCSAHAGASSRREPGCGDSFACTWLHQGPADCTPARRAPETRRRRRSSSID